jgi:hypothetical protein
MGQNFLDNGGYGNANLLGRGFGAPAGSPYGGFGYGGANPFGVSTGQSLMSLYGGK